MTSKKKEYSTQKKRREKKNKSEREREREKTRVKDERASRGEKDTKKES